MATTAIQTRVDKTCVICGRDTRKHPRKKDEFGRYAHVSCLEDRKRDLMLASLRPQSMLEHKPLFPGPEPAPRAEEEESAIAVLRRDPETRVVLWMVGAAAVCLGLGALWFGAALLSGFSLGFVAPVVALGAAIGASVLTGGNATRATGVLVACVVLLCVGATRVAVGATLPKTAVVANASFDPREIEGISLAWLASDIAGDMASRGVVLDWPIGVEPEHAGWFPEDFPAVVVEATELRWSGMNPAKRRAFQQNVLEELNKDEAMFAEPVHAGLGGTLGWLDLIWLPLAGVVAYKVGATPIVRH